MNSPPPYRKFLLSFVVFLAAMSITYALSHYLIPEKNHTDVPTVISRPIFYKSVGNIGSPKENKAVNLSKKYTVEILATQNRSEAQRLTQDLQKQSIKAFYTPLQQGTRIVYRVRQGVYKNAAQAKTAMQNLQKQGITGKVIRLD